MDDQTTEPMYSVGDRIVFTGPGSSCLVDGVGTIVRLLTAEEADLFETGPMYEVQIDSEVHTQHAFEDELEYA